MSGIREESMGPTPGQWPWGSHTVTRGVLVVTMLGMLASVYGCSGDEPAEVIAETPVANVAPAKENVDEQEREPVSEAPPTSPQTKQAEKAFQTLSAQGVTPAEWEAALQTLQEIGAPALPVLVDGLKSSEQVKREMASTVLALFGADAEPVADSLVAALDDKSSFVRANVAAALQQMPDQADYADQVVPVLAGLLESDEPDLKRMVATNLISVETDAARPLMPQLIASLDDEDRDVVYYCAQVLGNMGPDAAVALPKLRALETADDDELQAAVTMAIESIAPEADSAPEDASEPVDDDAASSE